MNPFFGAISLSPLFSVHVAWFIYLFKTTENEWEM